ncbi:Uncharacterized protein At5g65660 [Linum perenne]
MDSPDFPPPLPHHMDASRPSLGFPLGTALLLIVIFGLSGIFSCCYHWDKLRSLRRLRGVSDQDQDVESPPSKPNPIHWDVKENGKESVAVVMAGDEIPKFIALPCPCQPEKAEKVADVEVEEEKPGKPPGMAEV